DVVDCFKVSISEELSKVNQGMSDWTRLKNALRAEKYKYPKVVTQQLFKVLERLGLTLKEFDNLLELKNVSFKASALIKIMDPIEMWLLLQLAQEPVEKTYDEYLVERSKKSINIPSPEVRKPNEGVDESH
ncbi:4377_t:CDS:2, partial [Funneliformis mosseae]